MFVQIPSVQIPEFDRRIKGAQMAFRRARSSVTASRFRAVMTMRFVGEKSLEVSRGIRGEGVKVAI